MNDHSVYDHAQTDMGGPYTDYEQPLSQHPYYQQNEYASAPHVAQYAAPQPSYNQGYAKFEDGAGANFDGENDYDRARRPVRRERDDKVHDSIIEERIQRERPCRTLFIRNIKYETNSDDVRRQFEEHGEIKTFFDLISTRGMVFVTYFDLRAAERARDRLQGSEISGRPIDVHYSLPRDDQKGQDREKNQQFQGTLQVTLRSSPSGQPIDDGEVRRKFQQFGDVKSVRPVGERPDSRYVEFYDTRACDDAFDRLRHQGLQDGVMDIVFAWDVNDGNAGGPPDRGGRNWEEGGRGMRGGRGRGGRGRGRGRGFDEDYDRRGEGDHGRMDREPRGRGGRYEDDISGRGGRAGGGYNDRFDNSRGGYGGSAPAYGNTPGGYGMPPQGISQPPPPPPVQPAAAAAPVDDRLEQARKVQQLLAALKQPQTGPTPTSGTSAQLPPPSSVPMPAPPNSTPYYSQPPPSALTYPPSSSYGGVHQQPPPTVPQSGQAHSNPALNGLPPNILALLQATQQQQQQQPLSGPQYGGMPPAQMDTLPSLGPGSTPANAAQYQQLMSYLHTQASAAAAKH